MRNSGMQGGQAAEKDTEMTPMLNGLEFHFQPFYSFYPLSIPYTDIYVKTDTDKRG